VSLSELPYQAGLALEDLGTDAVELDLLLVDEYQDLNEADIKLVRLVGSTGTAVIAIGDDDQSIYSRRKAAPEGILRFHTDFALGHDYALSESHRCGREILAAARTLIESAPDRPAKDPLVAGVGVSAGCYAYLRFAGHVAEVRGVARAIAARITSGVAPKDIAVLVRSRIDHWSVELGNALEPLGLTLSSTTWVLEALEEPEVRRGIAIGHLTQNRSDSLSWWGLLTLTNRVGAAFVDYIYDQVQSGETFGDALLRLRIDGFPGAPPAGRAPVISLIDNTLSIVDSVELDGAILDGKGWGGWLLNQLDLDKLSADAIRLLEGVGSATLPAEGVRGLLANLEPIGKDIAANEADGVRMMTMGQSKGLTVNTAIVLGVEDGMIPLEREGVDVNEERRLLYVAMTRATDMCLLTYAATRSGQSARIGRTQVGRARNRSPLIRHLPGGVGHAQDGNAYVESMEVDASAEPD
jgi:DNA helicase-2/ATP-dependent DNA helicase PcrA